VAAFVVFMFGFILIQGLVGSGVLAEAFSSITASAEEKAAAARNARLQTYSAAVNQLVAAHPDENISVNTIDLSDNSGLSLGDGGTFTGASTAKLITAITLLRQTEKGKASLSKTIDGQKVGALLESMIVDSDNDAWESLNTYLTHDTLQAYMASIGWTEYDPDVNTLLPADMAHLMQKLYEGKLLDKPHTDLLLSYMQDANKQEYIVGSVPEGKGYTVYHKAGWLDGLMHDVAIISNGRKTIVLTIYTYQSGTNGDTVNNQDMFKAVTRAAVAAYFPAQ
jgi:beta-lactamase class A